VSREKTSSRWPARTVIMSTPTKDQDQGGGLATNGGGSAVVVAS